MKKPLFAKFYLILCLITCLTAPTTSQTTHQDFIATELHSGVGQITQMTFGPDGRLYVATTGSSPTGGVFRFDYDPIGGLTRETKISNNGSTGIAFHSDPVSGNTYMYLNDIPDFTQPVPGGPGIMRRLTDSDGDGIWGGTNDINQQVVTTVPIIGQHRMNQIQIDGNSLFVGIGSLTGDGSNASAYNGTVGWIEDLTLLTDTVTPNVGGFAGPFVNGSGVAGQNRNPFTSTAAETLRVFSTGLRNPFGIGLDGDQTLWVTNNQLESGSATPPDELFRAFHKADFGFPQYNILINFRNDPTVRDAGFFLPNNTVDLTTGLGANAAAGGVDFAASNELPLYWHKQAFVPRWTKNDVWAVDVNTGVTKEVMSGVINALDTVSDPQGNILVAEGTLDPRSGRIFRLNASSPHIGPHLFAWSAAGNSNKWSEGLNWLADLDGDGVVNEDVLSSRVWSVDFQPENGKVMSGQDPVVGLGGRWNPLEVAARPGSTVNPSIVRLIDNNGISSGLGFSVEGTVSAMSTSSDQLVSDSIFVGGGIADNKVNWHFNGLNLESEYHIYAFGSDLRFREAGLTIDVDGNRDLENNSLMRADEQGLLFENISPNADGTIVGEFSSGNWAGLHLIEGAFQVGVPIVPLVPHQWGTQRYDVTINSRSNQTIVVDQDVVIESLTIGDALSIEGGQQLRVTGDMWMLDTARVAGDGALSVGGELRPSHGGMASFAGGLELAGDSAQLLIEISGADPLQSNAPRLAGPATLDGQLAIEFSNEFLPTLGQRFEVLSASEIVNSFDSVVSRSDDLLLAVEYDVQTVSVSIIAVPEPSWIVLMLSGLTCLRIRPCRSPKP